MRDEEEWVSIDEDMVRSPGEVQRKLRLLVDEDVPTELVRELRRTAFAIATVQELDLEGHGDPEVYERARQEGLVLFTMDGQFYRDDRRYRMDHGGGVIFIDASPADVDKAVRAVWFLNAFARTLGGKMASGMKIRALPERFFFKTVTDGQKYEWEIKGIKGVYHAREVQVPRQLAG